MAVGVWPGGGGQKEQKKKKRAGPEQRQLSHSLGISIFGFFHLHLSIRVLIAPKTLLKPGEHHVIGGIFLLVTCSAGWVGKARWPRVDGKPHTAMTFAVTVVFRQPSWGCFGGVPGGPAAQAGW